MCAHVRECLREHVCKFIYTNIRVDNVNTLKNYSKTGTHTKKKQFGSRIINGKAYFRAVKQVIKALFNTHISLSIQMCINSMKNQQQYIPLFKIEMRFSVCSRRLAFIFLNQ